MNAALLRTKKKLWKSLTYPTTQSGRKCPTKQPGGCQFPTRTIGMMQR